MMSRKQNCVNVNENPCNMCMPMGAILALKGIERSMVLIHGSQGCATYMRRHIAEHFNEPIDAGSSSLNEKGTVYGGEANLKQGLDNVRKVYHPAVIGVLTTCLAETIGEDIERINAEYIRERDLGNFPIISVPTPGYGGTHFEGYWLALRRIVESLAGTDSGVGLSAVNIIVPNISPADIREIKRILELMQVKYTLLPDFSDTLDRPYTKPYRKVPEGGTPLAAIRRMSGAQATIQFGSMVESSLSPGNYLADQFGVPLYNLPIPVGLRGMDRFVEVLREITRRPVPDSLEQERGRLLDCMIDSHKHNFAGRSVVFGEPELVWAVVRLCAENGAWPVVAATGSRNNRFAEAVRAELAKAPKEARVLTGADFAAIRQAARETGANIAIGHSDGRYLTECEGIPLVRLGFPIHDRMGGQRLLSVGYTGTTQLLDRITNSLLENKLRNYRSSMYEQFYRTGS